MRRSLLRFRRRRAENDRRVLRVIKIIDTPSIEIIDGICLSRRGLKYRWCRSPVLASLVTASALLWPRDDERGPHRRSIQELSHSR